MVMTKLKNAIDQRKKVVINYKGTQRTINPYLIGINTKDHKALRAYQIAGYSSSGKVPSWKMFLLDEILDASILNEQFSIDAEYNPNDKAMKVILHRV